MEGNKLNEGGGGHENFLQDLLVLLHFKVSILGNILICIQSEFSGMASKWEFQKKTG